MSRNGIRSLIIAMFIFVVLYVFVYLFWINVVDPPPYQRVPPLTKHEQKIKITAKKYNGVSVVIISPERIYFKRDGEEITIYDRKL